MLLLPAMELDLHAFRDHPVTACLRVKLLLLAYDFLRLDLRPIEICLIGILIRELAQFRLILLAEVLDLL